MTQTITQKVIFKNTTPKELYELYMNAEKHSEIIGDVVKISDKEGTVFRAYDTYITGKNLQLIKDSLIVQSWRADDWDKEDMDSTFIIKLETKGKDVVLKMTHANVPETQAEALKRGWNDFYWEPWKEYIKRK